MRSPLRDGPWLTLDVVESTQDEAVARLGSPDCPGVVFARHQENGRGRFGRVWKSDRGDSLTMSLVYRGYSGHRKPWLIGMAVALAVARVVDGRVRWPNDVVKDGRKVAGVLTELVGDPVRVPVIGVGLNLRYSSFLAGLEMAGTVNAEVDAEEVARQIVAEIERVPEPSNWASISQLWFDLDDTPDKAYRLHSGELAVALRVGNDGSLVCSVNGEQRSVMAAEAILGPVL